MVKVLTALKHLEITRANATITITQSPHDCLEIRNGRVIKAKLGWLAGLEALSRWLALQALEFNVTENTLAMVPNVSADSLDLQLLAIRALEEFQAKQNNLEQFAELDGFALLIAMLDGVPYLGQPRSALADSWGLGSKIVELTKKFNDQNIGVLTGELQNMEFVHLGKKVLVVVDDNRIVFGIHNGISNKNVKTIWKSMREIWTSNKVFWEI